MSRARGNARKKKVRLTDHTAASVMEIAPRKTAAESAPLPEEQDALSFSILDLLRSEPDDPVSVPAAYNEAAHIFTEAAGFAALQFVLGLVVCPQCRNEMIYYQDRSVLAGGYSFRCRICQHELVASVD